MEEDTTVRAVWDDLIEAKYLYRYYGYTAERLALYGRTTDISSMMLTSAAALVLLPTLFGQQWGAILGAILALLAAIIQVIGAFAKFGERAGLAAQLQLQWAEAQEELARLWAEIPTLKRPAIWDRKRSIADRTRHLTAQAARELRTYRDLQNRAFDEAVAEPEQAAA